MPFELDTMPLVERVERVFIVGDSVVDQRRVDWTDVGSVERGDADSIRFEHLLLLATVQ